MARNLVRRRKVTVVEDQVTTPPPTAVAKEKLGAATAATGTALASVASTVGPALDDARHRLAPVAEQALAQSKRQGRRAALKLGMVQEPVEPETHKIRNLMVMLGLGAMAAAAYKMLSGKDADPAWTAGRDSAAAPTAPVTVDVVDEYSTVDPVMAEPAGSDPLMSDVPIAGSVAGSETAPTAPLASTETVESPVPTTPDEPLDRRDLT